MLTASFLSVLQLVDLLVAQASEAVTTVGFEQATVPPPATDNGPTTDARPTTDIPATASDTLSHVENGKLPAAESTAEPTAATAETAPPPPSQPTFAQSKEFAATHVDPSTASQAEQTTTVPDSTITASFPYSKEDLTETLVDEVPVGIEQSADGEDEKRGGNDVLGTDKDDVHLGDSPVVEKGDTHTQGDVDMQTSAAPAEEVKPDGEDVSMNDAESSVPVVAAPASGPAPVPTAPPPTPAVKRSMSPEPTVEPVAKRVKQDLPSYPAPANFVSGTHPPTTALYITNLRRPLPDSALIDLLEEFGELDGEVGIGKGAGKADSKTEKEGWWLSPIKSHAFAAVSSRRPLKLSSLDPSF